MLLHKKTLTFSKNDETKTERQTHFKKRGASEKAADAVVRGKVDLQGPLSKGGAEGGAQGRRVCCLHYP